jgi:hypothetical protein
LKPITNKVDAYLCLAQIARQLRATSAEMDAAGLVDWPSMVEACADEVDRIAKQIKNYG